MSSPNKGNQTLLGHNITQTTMKSKFRTSTIGNPKPKFANHGWSAGCSLSTLPIRNNRTIAMMLATETSLRTVPFILYSIYFLPFLLLHSLSLLLVAIKKFLLFIFRQTVVSTFSYLIEYAVYFFLFLFLS